jgi:glycine dehydrogenase
MVHSGAVTLSTALEKIGYKELNGSYFDTLSIKANTSKIRTIAESNEVNFFYPNSGTVSISINETTTLKDLNAIVAIFAKAANMEASIISELVSESKIPIEVSRKTEFLSSPVFNTYHSETELMRYIKK